MLTEMLKIKLHNALFAAEFRPMNSFRIFWNLRNELSYAVTLGQNEWSFNEDTSDPGIFDCGDYSDENVAKLLDLISNS